MNKHFEGTSEVIKSESTKRFDDVAGTDSPKSKFISALEKMEEKSKIEESSENISPSDKELKAVAEKIRPVRKL